MAPSPLRGSHTGFDVRKFVAAAGTPAKDPWARRYAALQAPSPNYRIPSWTDADAVSLYTGNIGDIRDLSRDGTASRVASPALG